MMEGIVEGKEYQEAGTIEAILEADYNIGRYFKPKQIPWSLLKILPAVLHLLMILAGVDLYCDTCRMTYTQL